MVDAGILAEDDRVELLEGDIVEMAPIGSRHAACVNRLNQLLSTRIAGPFIVAVQNPIRLGEFSEPQPDLAILRPRPDFYSESHPGPEDILLLVEVSDTSAEYDREVKVPAYGTAAIPEVWLVDLASGRHRGAPGPHAGALRQRRGGAGGEPSLSPGLPGPHRPGIGRRRLKAKRNDSLRQQTPHTPLPARSKRKVRGPILPRTS